MSETEKPYKVKSIEDLKRICQDRDQLDCFILLNGNLRSSKTLMIDSDKQGLVVCNEIDGSDDEFDTWEGLNDEEITNVGKAIKLGGFFVFGYEKVKEV